MPFVFNVRAQNFNEKCQCAREARGGTSSPATRGRTCDNPIGKAQPQRTGSEPCLMQFVIQHKMPGIRLTTTQAPPFHPLYITPTHAYTPSIYWQQQHPLPALFISPAVTCAVVAAWLAGCLFGAGPASHYQTGG